MKIAVPKSKDRRIAAQRAKREQYRLQELGGKDILKATGFARPRSAKGWNKLLARIGLKTFGP